MTTTIHTDKAPAAVGPYAQGRKAGPFTFLSGQIAIDPATGAIPEAISAQAEQVMKNIAALLAASGAAFDDIIKTTIFLTDLSSFGKVNDIYASFFTGALPARSCVEVSALPKGALVEIECVVYKE